VVPTSAKKLNSRMLRNEGIRIISIEMAPKMNVKSLGGWSGEVGLDDDCEVRGDGRFVKPNGLRV